ncbi:MAG TPA: hypothetical protein VKV74_11960 [Bryobacteraceae bacterium]|nr:hypothetical protein [Bryobacteraceae bacterium]
MRCVLLHYHFFKNAGTTIEEILAHSFGHFARLDNADPNRPISNSELLGFLERNPEIQAVSSHHIHYPVPQAKGFLFFDICILRDPIDRVYSMYGYFRKKPFSGYALSDLANRTEPGEFFTELVERAPFYVNDVQVNLVANGEWDRPPGEDDLERATRRMVASSFPGAVDCFLESLVAAEHTLKPIFPTLNCAQPPANASVGRRVPAKEVCPPAVYERLLELNQLDYELLRRTRSEALNRFQGVPRHMERLRALAAAGKGVGAQPSAV